MEEQSILMENNCYICDCVVYKHDSVFLDQNCKVLVHKSCKKKYLGSCPLCGKNVVFENENKFGILLYTCCISSVFFIFLLGFICFFVLLIQHA